MRIDASVSVRSFLEAAADGDEDERAGLEPLRPLVPQLLQQFLALSNEVRVCEVCAGAGGCGVWGDQGGPRG